MDELTEEKSHELDVRERWLGAVCYLGPGWLAPIVMRGQGAFLRWHVQQGFVLFFAEVIGVTLLVILDGTLGRIPILGMLILVLLQLVFFVSALILSVLGFVKALAGEEFHIPVLDEYAARIPIDLG